MTSDVRPETPRKQRVADAAIEVIAAEGLRGLTHRAADAWAQLPPGSASSCFRTRLALLSAVLQRIVELDEQMLSQFSMNGWNVDTHEGRERIVDTFTELLEYWLGPGRVRARARLEIYLDAARRPELQPDLRTATRRFVERAAAGMRSGGLPLEDESARILLAQIDGLLYDAMARPFYHQTEHAVLRREVEVVIAGHLATI
ncbi:TetR/AcrR family transcriptional regulator [Phytoactinopolyspora mesophila]|uniref:Tetracyclin repressor-like C-terminal group 31 domain-containing protein n=1 Tax=Phytoactinopolyspora mesophila TaxID=2650750 RepID=A0A7K3LY18_9ACTN|nr:TetR/AcrR family transcriptional regulator [Phytoactinopolyspora mesophila]NDL55926.1 hypothetical protein [Phytoactinopolyspora mesophila]